MTDDHSIYSVRHSTNSIYRDIKKNSVSDTLKRFLGANARKRRPKGETCAQLISPISMKLSLYVAPSEIRKR